MKTNTCTALFRAFLVPVLLASPGKLVAQWVSIGNVTSVERVGDGVIVSAKPAMVQLSVIAPEVIRVRMTAGGTFLPDSSWAVVQHVPGPTSYTLTESADELVLSTSKLKVHVRKSPCRLAFYDANGNRINQDDPSTGMSWSGTKVVVWKTMPQDEQYFGFGEKAGAFNRKWTMMSMWNSDIPAYKADTDPLYETIPFFYGIRKGATYGIFFDNSYYSFFNMGKEHPDLYSFGAVDGELNYYFLYGPKPKDVLERFSTLVGRMPLPPKWAVGYQQCRYSYYPESRVRELASTFRAKKIPCDVIYLDIHYMDGYRCFTWDNQRFPDPKKMIRDLANDGFKVAVIIDPGIKNEPGYWVYDEGMNGNHFVKYPDGKPFIGKVWPGMCVFPDFTRTESRQWWGTLYRGLLDNGVRGFWNDMNEPSVFDVPTKTFDLSVLHDDQGLNTDHRKNHNVYGMQMARGTYEGVAKLRPNERPFVLTRASYAGGNRYAAAWTGDNISSWEHLEMAVPMCMNLSISGQPFVGTDIGGFVGSPSGELYTRWLQLGTFTPLMRTHTEIGSADQEPWSYGPAYEAINKKSIELRYKLLPYIYTQFYTASQTGIPMMRPVFFDFPEDESSLWNDREFMFGDAFLVAPVVWPGATTRSVRLPPGEWYNYWTGEEIKGANSVTVDAPIDRIPLFVKAGSIIPTQQVVQYSDEQSINPLTIELYPAREQSSTILYEDDGTTFEYLQGKFCRRTVSLNSSAKEYRITLSNPEGSFRPPERNIVLKLKAVPTRPSSVQIDGLTLREPRPGDQRGWQYDEKMKVLSVTFEDKSRQQKIQIKQ